MSGYVDLALMATVMDESADNDEDVMYRFLCATHEFMVELNLEPPLVARLGAPRK